MTSPQAQECDCVASAAEGACFELCPLHSAAGELLEGLKKYGTHTSGCKTPFGSCDCGYLKLLSRAEGKE